MSFQLLTLRCAGIGANIIKSIYPNKIFSNFSDSIFRLNEIHRSVIETH